MKILFSWVISTLLIISRVASRSWTQVELIHSLDPIQPFDVDLLFGPSDPMNTPAPTGPTASPTFPATSFPTGVPTLAPTFAPTVAPTGSPTYPLPTHVPTDTPTIPYPFIEPPDDPDPWYFNYDMRPDARYGPGHPGIAANNDGFTVAYKNNGWSLVANPPDFYWREFSDDGFGPWKGVLANHNPETNRCHRVGRQSPIDVRHNGLGKCREHHETRSFGGDFRIIGNRVTKKIMSNKLQLVWDRRPCGDLKKIECQEPDPPKADFPNGWGGFADAMHVDFKIPSEHLINGKRFDAEMQIYHLHPGRRRMPSVATVIVAKDDGYNWYFEGALLAFEFVYEQDEALCYNYQQFQQRSLAEAHANLGTNLTRKEYVDFSTANEYSTIMDRPDYQEYADSMERMLQNGRWDPHHEMLVPSIYFYRYEGSLTEPPCGEWVSWFVTDEPMTISTEQLQRMKKFLFKHRDHMCRYTSVHFEESVARPIQATAGRPVYLCTAADYLADPPKNV